jgi:hypothetical protein
LGLGFELSAGVVVMAVAVLVMGVVTPSAIHWYQERERMLEAIEHVEEDAEWEDDPYWVETEEGPYWHDEAEQHNVEKLKSWRGTDRWR